MLLIGDVLQDSALVIGNPLDAHWLMNSLVTGLAALLVLSGRMVDLSGMVQRQPASPTAQAASTN